MGAICGASLVIAAACLSACSIVPYASFHFTYVGADRLTSVRTRKKVPMSEVHFGWLKPYSEVILPGKGELKEIL